MKKEYSVVPSSMSKMETYGFSWMEFITSIPAPIFVVTSYKSNGKPNASLQSWAVFTGRSHGYYVIFSNIHKKGHLYQTLKDKKDAVLNFPSAGLYDLCYATIQNNDFNADEITVPGLTAEKASMVDAPCIKECFLHLECRFLWEKEIIDGDTNVIICLEVLNVCMDEAHMNEAVQSRYGDEGYVYNVHYPVNPESYNGTSHDGIAVIKKMREFEEY